MYIFISSDFCLFTMFTLPSISIYPPSKIKKGYRKNNTFLFHQIFAYMYYFFIFFFLLGGQILMSDGVCKFAFVCTSRRYCSISDKRKSRTEEVERQELRNGNASWTLESSEELH